MLFISRHPDYRIVGVEIDYKAFQDIQDLYQALQDHTGLDINKLSKEIEQNPACLLNLDKLKVLTLVLGAFSLQAANVVNSDDNDIVKTSPTNVQEMINAATNNLSKEEDRKNISYKQFRDDVINDSRTREFIDKLSNAFGVSQEDKEKLDEEAIKQSYKDVTGRAWDDPASQ